MAVNFRKLPGMYHFAEKSCLVSKNDRKRLLANINYNKTLLELVEMLGRL